MCKVKIRPYIPSQKRQSRMRNILFFMIMASTATSSWAGSLKLVLVPTSTTIKPNATATFDVYLYNSSRNPQKAPDLQVMSGGYLVLGTGKAEGWSDIGGTIPAEHILNANSAEHRQIKMQISAAAGKVVQVYVEAGEKRSLRSNWAVVLVQN